MTTQAKVDQAIAQFAAAAQTLVDAPVPILPGAFALLCHTGKASADAKSLTTNPIDTTGCGLLVLVLNTYAAAGTLFCNKLNKFLVAGHVANAQPYHTTIFYCFGGNVGPGHTFSLVSPGGLIYPALTMSGWSAPATAGFASASAGTASDSNSFNTGSITPVPSGLVIAGAHIEGDDSPPLLSIDSGFTISENLTGVGYKAFANGHGYLLPTSAAPVNPAFTLNGSHKNNLAIAASFHP